MRICIVHRPNELSPVFDDLAYYTCSCGWEGKRAWYPKLSKDSPIARRAEEELDAHLKAAHTPSKPPTSTCETCRHWHRHPYPNALGWLPHGTCAVLQVSGHHVLNKAPEGLQPMATTNADFGCNRWEGRA